jgi:hypothetical protein
MGREQSNYEMANRAGDAVPTQETFTERSGTLPSLSNKDGERPRLLAF